MATSNLHNTTFAVTYTPLFVVVLEEADWWKSRLDEDVPLPLVALALWVWLPAATRASLSLDMSVLVAERSTSKAACNDSAVVTIRFPASQ